MELLYDVNLQLITDEHLAGQWRVLSRVLSQNGPGELIARAISVDLRAPNRLTIFAANPDEQQPGAWHMLRDDLLNRPYVALTLAGADPTRALVTRLRRASTGPARQLTLYFLSGMELVLAAEPDSLTATTSTSPV